jgi:hypothetical protein
MMMQMVASFAEFERAMIRERTSAGLAAARADGLRKKLDAAKRREITESVISGREPVSRWRGFTTSARRPCHVSSPSTAPLHHGDVLDHRARATQGAKHG